MTLLPDAIARDLQNAVQTVGRAVQYTPAGGSPRTIRARVRYLNAQELANSIEAYPLEVTVDARDFTTLAPLKGDTFIIDGTRRAVMQVRAVHVADALVGYHCGVAG